MEQAVNRCCITGYVLYLSVVEVEVTKSQLVNAVFFWRSLHTLAQKNVVSISNGKIVQFYIEQVASSSIQCMGQLDHTYRVQIPFIWSPSFIIPSFLQVPRCSL